MILLDALGTLVGLRPPAQPLARLLAERHGLRVSADQAMAALRVEMAHDRRECGRAGDARALAGLRRECADLLAGELGLPQDGALTDTLLAALRFAPYDEVPDALAALQARGEELVVLSNWDVSLHEVLAGCGLSPYFARVVTSAELGLAKPDPRSFAAALGGADPALALHVGDSVAEDIEGARGAGIEAVLLRRPPGGELLAPGAGGGEAPAGVRTIASLTELL